MAGSVVIVGGGSAGWMTAAYLRKALDAVDSITVIESSAINTIGVGEATFSTIRLFFDFLGLDEKDWMPSCNCTYKIAIRFVNWQAGPGHFYHPFERLPVVDGYSLGEWWLKLKRGKEPFDYSCFNAPALCDHQRSPRFLDGKVFDEKVQEIFAREPVARNNQLMHHQVQYPYAYHFDATLLAHFLRDYAMARGVKHIVDNVEDVPLREDGSIAHIVTGEHGAIAGDLYVDCTGFRGLLLNKALGEPFISFSDSLLCDSAVALRVPVDIEANGINPFTTATAMSAGWIWNIPLYGRVGTGYVYGSRFQDKDDAEREIRAHLGPASDSCPANHIKMRIGRSRRSWVKNCVAIGLSSGFVEPLESTGIFFIQHGIEELVHHFPALQADEEMIKSYNRAVAGCIDGVRDFLILHYRGTDRRDTEFWKATEKVTLPPYLAERLALWKARLPNDRNITPYYHGFESYSYAVMLLGLGYQPRTSLPVLDHIDGANALAAFRAIRERSARLTATLPSQYEYLTQMRGEPVVRRLPRRQRSARTAAAQV
ncbi:MAG TPA: tryptophan halogenase family protein [Thermoanaerobaculia bacterium]|nr:tryptophan halogenase family protein [Thermoanaerobaculia bacterium]